MLTFSMSHAINVYFGAVFTYVRADNIYFGIGN